MKNNYLNLINSVIKFSPKVTITEGDKKIVIKKFYYKDYEITLKKLSTPDKDKYTCRVER